MHEPQGSDSSRPSFPFTAYDVFGYLIPGSIALAITYSLELWCRHSHPKVILHTPIYSTVINLGSVDIGSTMNDKAEMGWYMGVLLLAAILIVAYSLGHIISSISSLLLDRVLIKKGHGYPYEHLLGFETEEPERRPEKQAYYRMMAFYLNVIFLLLAFAPVFPGMLLGRVAAVIFGVVLSLCGSRLLALALSHSAIKKDRSNSVARRVLSGIEKLLVWLAAPYSAIASTFAIFAGTRKPVNRHYRTLYLDYFYRQFGIDAKEAGTDNFWLCRYYIRSKSVAFEKQATHWEHQYAFVRNLSTALFGAALYSVLLVRWNLTVDQTDYVLKWAPIVLFMAACLMLSRFWYLYVCYFSKFVFRGFVFLNQQDLAERVSSSAGAGGTK